METQSLDDQATRGRTGPASARRWPRGAGETLAAAPTAIALVLLLTASESDGAFALRSWAPLAVFVLVALALAPYSRVSGAALAFPALFGAFAAWSLLSMTWSERPGEAFVGASLSLLYAGLAALPVLTLPSRSAALRIAWLLVVGFGVLAALGLVSNLGDAASHFLAGRLDDPVGYRNGTAALFAMAFWPLVAVAAQRTTHPLLRALCFALAVCALGLAFLTQSRGVVIGFVCGAAVTLALGPDRVRRLGLTLVALVAIAIVSSSLLAPYDAFLDQRRSDPQAIDDAVRALAIVTAAGFVVALLLALLDGGLRISTEGKRRLRAAGAIVLAVVALVGVGIAVASTGDPVAYTKQKVQEFKRLEPTAGSRTRLTAAGGQRYDLWRIAWHDFQSSPIAGSGEGGYSVRYYRERATDRNLSTPHSLVLQVLGELGLIGALLIAGALIAAGLALARGWRTASLTERRWASALAAAAAVSLGQQTVDWLWLIPAVTGLGVMCLSTAVALVSPRREPALARSRGRWTIAMRVPYGLAAVVVALLFMSDAYSRAARADSTSGRLSKARTAQTLNPFDLTPRYLQAGALEESGDVRGARRVLLDALDVEPTSFTTMALIGDLETRAGNRARARLWYRRALYLNPRDTGLQQLAR